MNIIMKMQLIYNKITLTIFKMKLFIISLLFYATFIINGVGQTNLLEIREDEKTKISEDSENVKSEIKDLLTKFLIRFQQASTMIDLSLPSTDEQLISAESQSRFTSNFSYSSKIYNDLQLYPEVISPKDYAAFVATYYPKGISPSELTFTDVLLKDLRFNVEAQIYEISIRVSKVLNTAVDENKLNPKKSKIKTYKEGREHKLDMVINVSESLDYKTMSILSIIGERKERPAEKKRWLNLSITAGLNKPEIGIQAWANNSSSLIKVSPGISFGPGLSYSLEILRRKGHYFVGGINSVYHTFNIKSDQIDCNFENQVLAASGIRGAHVLRIKDFSESSIFTLEGLFGLSFNFTPNSIINSYGLGLFIKPVYSVYSGKANGKLTMHQIVGNTEVWCTEELNQIPERNFNPLNFFISASPFYEFDVDRRGYRRMRINLDINYSLTNWIKGQDGNLASSDFISGNQIINPSLNNISLLFSSFKPHYLGFRLEYKFNLNPNTQ